MNNLPYRFTLIFAVLLSACYLLYPTYQYYTIDEKSLELYSAIEQKELKTKALSLGLDLQGGIEVILECDLSALLIKMCEQSNRKDGCPENIITILNKSNIPGNNFFTELENNIENSMEMTLGEFYSKLTNEKNNSTLTNTNIFLELKKRRDISVNNAVKIIKTRLNSTGLGDPNIQRLGANRISIELAGVTEKQRVMNLIEGTGALEFRLVYSPSKTISKINEIDNYLKSNESATITNYNIFYNHPQYSELGMIWIDVRDIDKVNALLNDEGLKKKIAKDGKFIWGKKIESMPDVGVSYATLYYVKRNVEVSGGDLKSSQANIAPPEQRLQSGKYVIDVVMSEEGSKKWRRTTGKNIGSRVAIILDDEVYMAPVINDRIPNGKTQVSGLDSFNEAEDIVTVLAAGEMDAFRVEQDRLIKASLGLDAIEAGKKSITIGLILVIMFMIIYYRLAGFIASIAMIMNLVMIVAALSMFGWVDENMMVTLTLPGIAGLILTIGMTVDANVIIFERIKEELRTNKTISKSVELAYQRALVTILDANFTTLIAAIVLAGIGSGPIKGFAITLGVGILCSMFTAIFVTKTIFLSAPNFNFIQLKNRTLD